MEPIGNWYIHKKRRGLICLVIDNRHAVNRLKHFEDLVERVESPSDSSLIEDEQPLKLADIFPISPSHHRRGQSPDRNFVVAFRNHTPQHNRHSRPTQEPVEDSPQVGRSKPNSEILLRLSSPRVDQDHMDSSTASDVESISQSPSFSWSQKSAARGRSKNEPATSRLILDVIPHEAADDVFKSAQNMRGFTLLEAMAEETIDTLIRRWTHVDAKRFSEYDGSSISSTEASAPMSQGRTSHNSHEEINIDPDEISSGLQNNTRKRRSDLLRYNGPKTELDGNRNEALEENATKPYAFPVGSNPNGKKRPDPLHFVPQNVDGDLGVKAKGEAYTPSDQGLQSSKTPSTPAPPYPSGHPDQCLSCKTSSTSAPIPRPDPHQLADAEARETEISKETGTSMNTAFELFEKRILEMMKDPSFQQSRVIGLPQTEIEQPEPRHRSTDDYEAEPVILKDCLGRKFLFPIQTCRSWQVSLSEEPRRFKANLVTIPQNMENLIRRSFSHIESLNSKIFRGSYDILSPTGEIVLPEIWDTVIKPGWVVELRFWDYTKAGETNKKDPDVDLNEIASVVQSPADTAKKTSPEASLDVQLPIGKRRASLGKWLSSRKSTPNITLE